MASQFLGMTTSSNDVRYRDDAGPKTPEPLAPGADEPSLPPPRPRLRLKRRHMSQLNAPTQHFLASIAAADVPMPSVEDVDQDMMDTLPEVHVEDLDNFDDSSRLAQRIFSPPKTPAIDFAHSLTTAKFPDWYSDSTWSESDLDSSPDYESSRPSTAFSTQTSSSLFSSYSCITDDANGLSPDSETTDVPQKIESENAPSQSERDRPRKAPWTRAMSSHLWSTYMLYLSDPRVTPIRLGKGCIPPHGVCARVARQAQRSWKGSKPQQDMNDERSRSTTPTMESTKTYIRWPHTGGATRAHLRELCKMKASSKPGRYLSQSPPAFNKAANRRWHRRNTPARSPSVFSAQDMAMSLTLSTSDTMQPHGPLAQLTSSQLLPVSYEYQLETTSPHEQRQQEPVPKTPEAQVIETPYADTDISSQNCSGRLGSPFLAKSYGPSSSSIASKITLPKQPNTVGPRRLLGSPVRLTRSRSGTQKRRSTKGTEDKPWRRPSLAAAFFREGSRTTEAPRPGLNTDDQTTQHAAGLVDGLSRQIVSGDTSTASSVSSSSASGPFVVSAASSQASTRPPRLGSPFSATNSSHSFPNRLSAASNFSLTALRRPFATVQQPQPAPSSPAPVRSSLASRLAYLDQRLKELRNRGTDRRRSLSPF
ncbi:hypothetical protein F4777DRAFT_254530 [Nemania sp. FL0916]|nr:hypothetical protein F4777DRAFT_254530 [Nemania sp. FL0916]